MTVDEHFAAAKNVLELQRDMMRNTPKAEMDVDFYERFVILSEYFANHMIAGHTLALAHENAAI